MRLTCVIQGEDFKGTLIVSEEIAVNLDLLVEKKIILPISKSLRFKSLRVSIQEPNQLGFVHSISKYRGAITIHCWSFVTEQTLCNQKIFFDSILFDSNEPPKVSRNANLVKQLKEKHGHQCMSCNARLLTLPEPRTDAHHVISLHMGGPDIDSNIVVLCPNCHAVAHSGSAEGLKQLWEGIRVNCPEKYCQVRRLLANSSPKHTHLDILEVLQ